MNIGLYSRKSNYKDTSESTQMQLSVGRKYIEDHMPGPHSFFEYEDDGFVRTNTNRPGFKQMMADVDAGLLDVIVAWKFDRISGDMKDFCLFYSHLVEKGVRLVVVTENIDTTTPLGEAMMYIAVVFAQLEVANDSERVTENMLDLAKKGFWPGGPAPVGYEIIQIAHGGKSHKTLQPVPAQIEYKNQLIDTFLQGGYSLQGMETYCKNNGIRTLRGAFLSTTQIYHILTTPVCVSATPAMYDYFQQKGCIMSEHFPREKWDGKHGIIVYGRTTQKNGTHRLNPPEKWLVSVGKHEPYMDDELFFRILGQLKQNTFERKKKYDIPLLKGTLRCSCGCLMQVSRKKKTHGVSSWYYCIKRMRKGVDACPMGQIKIDLLDEKVLEILRSIAYDEGAVEKYMASSRSSSTVQRSAGVLRQMNMVKGKIDNLAGSLAQNQSSAAAKYIIEEIERLDAQYQSLKAEHLSLAADERIAARELRSANDKKKEIVHLLENFDAFSADEKNAIVKSVLKECVWDGETLFVTL